MAACVEDINMNTLSIAEKKIQGYYSQPSRRDGKICFVSEDDLYLLNLDTEEAVRLTVCGGVSAPLLSYDGSRVAFTSYCSGESEVYTISTAGGPIQQITYTGQCATRVVSWDQENEDVVYVTRSLVTTTRPDGQEVCALNL